MMELMRTLYQRIDNAHIYATYRTEAPDKVMLPNGQMGVTPFPYVVFKLKPIQSTEKDRDDYMLEVSCWDKPQGTSDELVMTIASQVRDVLTKWRNLDDFNLVFPSRPTLGSIPTEDDQYKRYDVTTLLKTYRRL